MALDFKSQMSFKYDGQKPNLPFADVKNDTGIPFIGNPSIA